MFLDLIIKYKELAVILLSSVIAVVIGECLRRRNYKKQQQEDFLRRLFSYLYQMSPTYRGDKKEIFEVLNEIKYWYSSDKVIKKQLFKVMDEMSSNINSQVNFENLVQKISQKAGFNLSNEEIIKVFSSR